MIFRSRNVKREDPTPIYFRFHWKLRVYLLFYLYTEAPGDGSLTGFKFKYLLIKGGYKMKYRRIIFIFLLLSLIGLMCLFVFAEKEVLPILTWDRTYGGRDDDRSLSLIQTTDGGYAVAGATSSKGAGHCDFWVIKLDKHGFTIKTGIYVKISYDQMEKNYLIQSINVNIP